MKGFLGTNADFLADLNLVLHIVMALTLLVGAWFALRKNYDTHQKIQTSVVLFNIILIAGIMVISYIREVVPGLPQNLVRARNSVATVHAVLGSIGELLGLYVVLRMSKSTKRFVPESMRFKNVKGVMRLTLGTWWTITLIGIATYYLWYMQPAEVLPGEQTTQPIALGGTTTVPIQNFVYEPVDLTIPVGTTVTWVNNDSAPHTVTADDGQFDSKFLDQGQSFSFKFDNTGKFPYYCVFHGNPGAGMAGSVTVLPAEEIAAVPTAITPPTATPRPSPPPPPAQPLGRQIAGTLAFQDNLAFSDAILLSLSDVAQPPAGQVYVGWLTTSAGEPLNLGMIPVGIDGRVTFKYSERNRENLLTTVDGFQMTLEPAPGSSARPSGLPVYGGSLPPQALAHLRRIVASAPDTPFQTGYAIRIRADAEEILRQAQFARDSVQVGDLASVKRHAEVIVNVIEGKEGRDYGDLDKDGRTLDPSDGFGLLRGSSRAGYLEAVAQAARQAAAAPDATQAIKVHTGHTEVAAANVLGWTEQARDKALEIIRASDAAAAQPLVQEVLALSQDILRGVDANGDGLVDAIPGEGGALTLYQHAQYSAAIGVTFSPSAPGGGTGQPTLPTPADTLSVTVRMLDFSFEPQTITVTLGANVTWINLGQEQHSATSDTNEWDTELLRNGSSSTFTFSKEGVFPYYCKLHGRPGSQGMSGVVVVQRP